MCGICGCGSDANTQSDRAGIVHGQDHPQHSRLLKVEQEILAKNDAYARANRAYFHQHNILALNLVSSPGAGKTSLLTATAESLKNQIEMCVIEGDQNTHRDSERVKSAGLSAVQINTGNACHLDAHAVGHAVKKLNPPGNSALFIENVGNLVCPAGFDLGEAHKVVILSVTEGEDKPIKYPNMFHAADLMILNKVDLLPYLEFDMEQCIGFAKQVNPWIQIIQLSSLRKQNLTDWFNWLAGHMTHRPTSSALRDPNDPDLTASPLV